MAGALVAGALVAGALVAGALAGAFLSIFVKKLNRFAYIVRINRKI